MFPGFETYDDGRVLLRARKRMRYVLIVFGVVSCGMVALAPGLAMWFGGSVWVPLAATVVLTLVAGLCIQRLQRLRTNVWRVAASARHVVTVDVARRQRTMAWSAVRRVEVSTRGLRFIATHTGREVPPLSIGSRFGPYIPLAHRLVAQAERRRIPIWVDGSPLDALDVDTLFPTLRADLEGSAE